MKTRIVEAIKTVISVHEKEETNIISGFTPSLKYYGYHISVTFRDKTSTSKMQKFTTLLQKCLPEFLITEFESIEGKQWFFEVMLKE